MLRATFFAGAPGRAAIATIAAMKKMIVRFVFFCYTCNKIHFRFLWWKFSKFLWLFAMISPVSFTKKYSYEEEPPWKNSTTYMTGS